MQIPSPKNARLCRVPKRLPMFVKAAATLVTVVCGAVTSASAAQVSIAAPPSETVVMVDGKISANEWRDATHVEVPGVADIMFKRAAGFVYIAVDYKNNASGIVDLYLAPGDGSVQDLHASAKLGERTLHGGAWPDWTWWNNRDWVANVSRVDSWEKRTFLPESVREYQIRRTRFPSKQWRLRFELTTMSDTGAVTHTTVFPEKTSDKDLVQWLILRVD